MQSVKKNQIVVVLLVVMIVVAGYLNYRTQDEAELAEANQSQMTTGENSEAAPDDSDVTAEGVLLPEGAEEKQGEENQTADNQTSEPDTQETAQSLEENGEARAPGEAIMVESDAVVPEYFAEAKVERENARAKSQDMLYQLMAQADTPDEEKSEAAQKILELQKRIENEAAAEAMIKAKGFDEVYVRIYDDCVDVIVDREEITQQEAAQIQDILTRITGLGADKIRISLLKIGS